MTQPMWDFPVDELRSSVLDGHHERDGRSKAVTWHDPATLAAASTVLTGREFLAIVDSAAGCAVHSLLLAGAVFGTIEIKTSFLEPLYADVGEIDVHGRALRVGGRVGFAEAHARDAAGRLVGHATTSIAVIRR